MKTSPDWEFSGDFSTLEKSPHLVSCILHPVTIQQMHSTDLKRLRTAHNLPPAPGPFNQELSHLHPASLNLAQLSSHCLKPG